MIHAPPFQGLKAAVRNTLITLALFISAGTVMAQTETITVPLLTNPGTMNPLMADSTAEVIMARILFDGLTILNPDTFAPEPHLAERWETSEDGLTWTFYLRDNVTWHDGEPFTAEDVKFSIDTIVDPETGSSRRGNFLLIQEVLVVDSHVVEIVLERPWAALPTYFAKRLLIGPKHLLEGKDLNTTTQFNKFMPIGTGGYMMVENRVGSYIQLKANPDYFRGEPDADTVYFKILPDSNTQVAQLLTGELDFIPIEYQQVPAVVNNPKIRIESAFRSLWYAFHLNTQYGFFQDQKVRQAISYAIDRELLIDTVLLGYGTPATGPIIPSLEPYYTDDVKTYPYDPERARELLAEAGWADTNGDGVLDKNGEPLRFEMAVIQGNSTIERASTVIQQNLKGIGMDPYMRGYEFSSFITEVRDAREGSDMSQSYFVWMTPAPEPDGIYAYFHSSNALSGSNFTVYRNPEVDELLERGRSTTDQEERVSIYHEIQRIMAEDLPRIFLAYPEELYAVREGVRGVNVTDPWSWAFAWEVVD